MAPPPSSTVTTPITVASSGTVTTPITSGTGAQPSSGTPSGTGAQPSSGTPSGTGVPVKDCQVCTEKFEFSDKDICSVCGKVR